MRSQTKEHVEIFVADGINAGEVQLATADLLNEVLTNDRRLDAEAGPFCKAGESYEIKLAELESHLAQQADRKDSVRPQPLVGQRVADVPGAGAALWRARAVGQPAVARP